MITDPVKNNEILTTFSKENVRKVNADLFFNKTRKDFMFFHMAFEGAEIIAAHLLRKDEWFYGVYHGAMKAGFLYQGEKLTIDQQIKSFTDYLPVNRNDLQAKVDRYAGEIEFHFCAPEVYRMIGERSDRKYIQKSKH